MKIQKLSLAVIVSLFVGCGDASTEANAVETENTKTFKVAMDNSVHEVSGEFNSYKVVVYTDGKVDDKPSQSTKAVYGKINGKNTASLLTINSNYSDGDVFKVKVYEDDKLVGESNEKVLSGDTLEFSNIDI